MATVNDSNAALQGAEISAAELYSGGKFKNNSCSMLMDQLLMGFFKNRQTISCSSFFFLYENM
jgi:hypothetical protein